MPIRSVGRLLDDGRPGSDPVTREQGFSVPAARLVGDDQHLSLTENAQLAPLDGQRGNIPKRHSHQGTLGRVRAPGELAGSQHRPAGPPALCCLPRGPAMPQLSLCYRTWVELLDVPLGDLRDRLAEPVEPGPQASLQLVWLRV